MICVAALCDSDGLVEIDVWRGEELPNRDKEPIYDGMLQVRDAGALVGSLLGIDAEKVFARNAEIKVVAPSLGDTVVENVLSPPEVPCAQESHRAPDSRHGPARDADHGDRSPAADQPSDRTEVSRREAASAGAEANSERIGS